MSKKGNISMNPYVTQFMDAVTPYIIMLAVAILVLATGLVVNYGKTRGLQGQVTQLGKGGDKTTFVMPPNVPTGAGPKLLNAPVWNQLNDVLPDNQQDPYATTDCGEESVAMTVAACGGPALPAGVYRQLLGGPNRPGTSSAAELVYLLKLFRVPAHQRSCPADVAWIEWQHSFNAGELVIALGWWVTDSYNHWVVIRAIDDMSITFNDPWGGILRRMSKGWAMMKYQGCYIHIDTKGNAVDTIVPTISDGPTGPVGPPSAMGGQRDLQGPLNI